MNLWLLIEDNSHAIYMVFDHQLSLITITLIPKAKLQIIHPPFIQKVILSFSYYIIQY